MNETEQVLKVSNSSFEVLFSKTTGNLVKLTYDGVLYLVGELEPDFWCVPTDNDYGNGMVKRLDVWRDAHKSASLSSFNFEQTDKGLNLQVVRSIDDITGEFNAEYTVYGDGTIDVVNSFTLAPYEVYVELPRIGMQTALSGSLQNVAWYGRGPHENYSDRKTSARMGVYSTLVESLYFPYIHPQENGYRTDSRWILFTNENGRGIRIEGDTPLSFGAQYYGKEQFCNAEEKELSHTFDLIKEDHISFNIDHKQMGVGGDNSWGALVHEEYRILPHEYFYTFTLSPVK